jgi:hypothetical protein
MANVDHESLQLHVEVSQVPRYKFDEYHPSVLKAIWNAAEIPLEPVPTPPEVNPDARRITLESPRPPSGKAIVPAFSVSHILHATKCTALEDIPVGLQGKETQIGMRPRGHSLDRELGQSAKAHGELESAPAEIARGEAEPVPTKIEASPPWRIFEYQEAEIRGGLGKSAKVTGNIGENAETVISIYALYRWFDTHLRSISREKLYRYQTTHILGPSFRSVTLRHHFRCSSLMNTFQKIS